MKAAEIKGKLEFGLRDLQEKMVFSRFPGSNFPILTIDAAYHDSQTERLLDILEQYHSSATFFLCGTWTERYAEKHIGRMEKLGCEIGNHSYDHPFFPEISTEEKLRQIERTQELNESVSVQAKKYFRFPYGSYQTKDLVLVKKLGYQIIGWSVESLDWKFDDTAKILSAIEKTSPGDILLMHNDGMKTADALEEFLRTKWESGQELRFGTVTEAMKDIKPFSQLGFSSVP